MDSPSIPLVLIVANKTAATPALLAAVRSRAEQGPATFHLLVPNPKTGEWRPSSIHHPDLTEGEQVLALALPLLSEAAGTPVLGTVSPGEFIPIAEAERPGSTGVWFGSPYVKPPSTAKVEPSGLRR